MLKRVSVWIAALCVVLGMQSGAMAEEKVLKMSTTTSTQSSGLLDLLLPEFKKDTGVDVKVIAKGSSLKFCLVAEGNADVYPRFAPTMEWDTAAAQAVCNAAGIEVVNYETNKSLSYNKENLLNPWFLVSNI